MQTPLGVKVLAILSILGGIFGFLWSLFLSGLGGISWFAVLVVFEQAVREWGGGKFWGGLLGMVTGVLQVIVGFGLLTGKRWAWLLAAISAGLSLVHPLFGLLHGDFAAIFGLIIPGLIFYYLTRPESVPPSAVRTVRQDCAARKQHAEHECVREECFGEGTTNVTTPGSGTCTSGDDRLVADTVARARAAYPGRRPMGL
jgi:hypothetical protein